MNIKDKKTDNISASYIVTAAANDLAIYKDAVASRFTGTVKVPGFRPGKAPTDMILKYSDQQTLQNEFLNTAVNDLYLKTNIELKLKIVGEPKINITKFVPFDTLEFSVEVPIITDIKLPDYHRLGLKKNKVEVTPKQLEHSLKELQKRLATPTEVKRPAKIGDLVIIDFDGIDTKTKEQLPPASAKDYSLVLGDNTLIPGFEENLVGLSKGKTKSFDLIFPKDYHDKSYANRKVTFKASIKDVKSLKLPPLDDKFASQFGPFKNLDELKAELKKQIFAEADRQATIELENKILNSLAEKTKVDLSDDVINNEIELLLNEARQASVNRGQTWQEYLASIGKSEEEFREQLKDSANTRIRGGIAIGEIATKEKIEVTSEEIDQLIASEKARYQDEAMQRELDNPNNRREIGMRLLTEKVLDFISKHQTVNKK